ncbi:MAG: CD225/dispanin family protein [Arenimonas sp.]
MKCPNCSAECADQALDCDFCGHVFADAAGQAAPSAPPASAAPPPLETASGSLPPPSPYASSPQANRPNVTVPNYLVWAIAVTCIATLSSMFSCCCIPLGLPSGIAAIVYALRVNKFLETGEVSSAEQASRSAKLWTWVTTVIAIIFSLWLIAVFVLQIGDPAFMEEIRKQVEANR